MINSSIITYAGCNTKAKPSPFLFSVTSAQLMEADGCPTLSLLLLPGAGVGLDLVDLNSTVHAVISTVQLKIALQSFIYWQTPGFIVSVIFQGNMPTHLPALYFN